MQTRHPSNLRNDVLTAAIIDHGLAVEHVAGPSAAYLYFIERRIPLVIVQRIMSGPRERRQLGVVGLPPGSR